MNKLILTLIFLFSAQISTYAQSNQIEAKAAYLLAEESFAAGDYTATLEYLKKATKSLGATNSKLLYLQIQAELEIYKTDRSYYDQIIKSISDFQNSADVNSFTEEKIIEIAKTKMFLIDEREQETKNNEEVEHKKKQQDLNFENWGFGSLPFGVTLDELKNTHGSERIFKDELKNRLDKYTGYTLHYSSDVSIPSNYKNRFPFPKKGFLDEVYGILTTDNIVKGYRMIVYRTNESMKIPYSQFDDQVKSLVKGTSERVGFNPQYTKGKIQFNGFINWGTYSWFKNDKAINIVIEDHYQSENNWNTSIVIEVIVD